MAVLSLFLPRGVMEHHREEHMLCRGLSLGLLQPFPVVHMVISSQAIVILHYVRFPNVFVWAMVE